MTLVEQATAKWGIGPAKNREQLERMLRMLSQAQDKQHLKDLVVLYLMDTSYSRDDIAIAHYVVEKEKGWHT